CRGIPEGEGPAPPRAEHRSRALRPRACRAVSCCMPGGILLDIDGVLTISWQPLPGAADAIDWLHEEGMPFRLVTNSSSKPRREIASLLGASGIDIDQRQILT